MGGWGGWIRKVTIFFPAEIAPYLELYIFFHFSMKTNIVGTH